MCILEPKEGQNCTFITGLSLKVQRRAEDENARKGDGNRMGRLTQKDDAGYWTLKSIPWGMLREGRIITKEVGQAIYGALCKLKDYEDTGWDPQRIQNWMYELEDMVGHVCDDLCRHRHNIRKDQDRLNRICEDCPVSACIRNFEIEKWIRDV